MLSLLYRLSKRFFPFGQNKRKRAHEWKLQSYDWSGVRQIFVAKSLISSSTKFIFQLSWSFRDGNMTRNWLYTHLCFRNFVCISEYLDQRLSFSGWSIYKLKSFLKSWSKQQLSVIKKRMALSLSSKKFQSIAVKK